MKLEYNLKKLYLDLFAPQPGEAVTFVVEHPEDATRVTEHQAHLLEMTKIWHDEMCGLAKQVGFEVKPMVNIEIRNPAPGSYDADAFIDGKAVDGCDLMDSWGPKDIVIAITVTSITGELVRRLPIQSFRFASAPTVRIDFEGFKADYSKIPLRFEILVQKMAKAASAQMTFRFDDQTYKCVFDLRGQRYLFPENGCCRRPGEFVNLPSGCANIQPYRGVDGDPRGKSQTNGIIPALIKDELVLYKIKENRIVEIIGDGPNAAKERKHILESSDPEMTVVTKLGLGVNDEARCNGVHVGDEKTMGMHWGYGPKKHFPDTIWAEHPIEMDMDFHYPDGSCEPIFRLSCYTANLGELF